MNSDSLTDLPASPNSKTRKIFVGAFLLFATLITVVFLGRLLFFPTYWVPSESMEPTLQPEDRIAVNKTFYGPEDIARGDIVVFDNPSNESGPANELVVRVIAIEGDTIASRNNQIILNGEPIEEAYLEPGGQSDNFGPVEIEPGTFWGMGDNREASLDSRTIGAIETELIVGKAMFLYRPLSRSGGL